MRKLISTILFVVLTISLSMISCKKESSDPDSDPDYCRTAWSAELSTEITAVTNASIAYSTAPSTATCNSYKTAYQNYINALKPFKECNLYTAAQKNEVEEAIAEAEADLSTLCK